MKSIGCLLTGATGIVGSHILFEWLKKSFESDLDYKIYLVIRNADKQAKQRLLEVLENDSRPAFMERYTIKDCLKKITLISNDVSQLDKQALSEYQFDTVIHCAGSTSLMHTVEAKEEVNYQNFSITKHLLEALPKQVNRFIYISTAYSFGIQQQNVKEGIEKFNVDTFRNPYEESKYRSEVFVKEYCANNNITPQILRPSIICGRLLEVPFLETPKFDVFYAWAIFLKRYAEKSQETFRIWIDKKSGLNIVPVDFVAKAVLYACDNPQLEELNIVNPKQILHKNYVGDVLNLFKVDKFEYVDSRPENLNLFESLYYKTIGGVFENYVSIPDLKFDTEKIQHFIDTLKLEANLGVHKNFINLIDFAVSKNFKESY